jgi:uncharacterized membrane protein
MIWPLLAAVGGTIGYGAGSVLQAAGAVRAQGLAVIVQWRYLFGLGCDGVAWLLSLLALQRLPLFTVQALLAGSLAVTVVLARIFLKTRLRLRDRVAVVLVACALAAAAAASGTQAAGRPPAWFQAGMLVALAVVAAATAALYWRKTPIPLAVLAGIGFSGAAFGARGVQTNGSIAHLMTSPAAWAIVAFGILGVLCYSRALESGAVESVTALMWVVEVVLPGLAGVLALGDHVRTGWAIPAVIAVLTAIGGCLVLATSPAQPET